MSYFKSLGENTGVCRIVACDPAAGRALIYFHVTAPRNASGLPSADKKRIAACASGLNACHFCYGVTPRPLRPSASRGGAAQLLVDVDSASVQYKLCPLLRYARKLTLEPARMTQIDADVVFAVGWGEAGLSDAALTISPVKFMNRVPENHGVKGYAELYATEGYALREHGYGPLPAALLPAKPW